MANPVGFEGSNFVFLAPADTTPEECSDLPVWRDGKQVISCWRLSSEELAIVAQTGVVWLSVTGSGTPPVCIAATGMLTMPDGGDPKAEPIMPRARRKT